jgi:transposase
LPVFETQDIVMKTYGKKYIKSKIKELKDKPIEFKIEMIKVKKARRLSKRVKFVLNMMSHYKFKQHLQHKCVEYSCELEIVTEEYCLDDFSVKIY